MCKLFALPYARTASIADYETLAFMVFAISGVCSTSSGSASRPISGDDHAPRGLTVLLAYTLAFAGIASLGYRRDERKRYA